MSGLLEQDIAHVVKLLEETQNKDRKVYTFGNGGSIAAASHFASDLTKSAIRLCSTRLHANSFTDNT